MKREDNEVEIKQEFDSNSSQSEATVEIIDDDEPQVKI